MLWFAQGSASCRNHFPPPAPLEISGHNSRVRALQKRWDRLRAGLDLILDQRGADMADLPGGASGLLCRDYMGKEADRLVTRIDPGVVSLVADLRGHEQQAAEESERWIAHHEERKPLDASPAAITLALLLTDEGLDSLEKSAGDGEIARAADQVDQMSQALNRLRAVVSLPKHSAPMPWPRLDAVVCSRVRERQESLSAASAPRDQRPQFPRSGTPKALGSARRRPRPDPGPAGRGHG